MEENVLFKADFVLDEADVKSYYARMPAAIRMRIIYLIAGALMIAYTVSLDNNISVSTTAAVIILLLVLAWRYPARAAKAAVKQMMTVTGSYVLHNEIVFCEQFIYDNLPNRSTRYTYRQIVKVKETKTLMFLMLSDNIGIIVRKDAFTVGDAASLVNYINTVRMSTPVTPPNNGV